MAKKIAPEKISEMPQPEKEPEIKTPNAPKVPEIPEEAPDFIPDEVPPENPPVELPDPDVKL